MTHILKSLPLVALIALAAPSAAQEQTGEEGTAPDPLALSSGEPDIKVGDVYQEQVFTDWEVRCIKSQDGNDPCQLYQLLDDGNGNPVAEINIFPLPGGEGQPAAGATVITPLETLLTEQLSMSVDGANSRKYPFSWCSQIGCFSRIGLSDAEIQQFRNGAKATLSIVPVVAPDQRIALEVSLSGFTAGFKAVQETGAANAAAAQE